MSNKIKESKITITSTASSSGVTTRSVKISGSSRQPKDATFCTDQQSVDSTIGNLATFLENEYKNRRQEIIKPNGFISTPLHVLKDLAAQQATEIHTEIFKINVMNSKKILWRIEIYVEETFGVAISPRRNLSLQLAAADLLDSIRKNYPDYDLALHGLITGSLITSTVQRDLLEYCNENGLPKPFYQRLQAGESFPILPKYAICCIVGEKQITGRSDNQVFAGRIAAKKMLEKISDEIYPDEVVKVGAAECGNLESIGKLKSLPKLSLGKRKWMEAYSPSIGDDETTKNIDANYTICKDLKVEDDVDNEEEEWFDAEDTD